VQVSELGVCTTEKSIEAANFALSPSSALALTLGAELQVLGWSRGCTGELRRALWQAESDCVIRRASRSALRALVTLEQPPLHTTLAVHMPAPQRAGHVLPFSHRWHFANGALQHRSITLLDISIAHTSLTAFCSASNAASTSEPPAS
jgi:hypothetical protein